MKFLTFKVGNDNVYLNVNEIIAYQPSSYGKTVLLLTNGAEVYTEETLEEVKSKVDKA